MATKKEHRIVHAGNYIKVLLAGQEVGLIQSVRANDDYGHEPASGVGDIHAQEYVPTIARHQIQVSTMVLFKNNLRRLGVSEINGDEVLKGNVFEIVVMSKDSNSPAGAGGELRKYEDCSYVSGDLEVTKHAIVASNAQFYARDVSGSGL